ncbi:ABC transporter permease [Candidatus Woesearchaeota archaeon]|nr:ABC transporter permease [Candidatus Woesearchaeota archaeon]
MNKLALIIKKNFLILVKSRWLSLVVVLGPLLIIFLTGIAFDNLNEYKINIGVYSDSYTELTNSFISKLNTEQFRTIKAKSEAKCIDDAKIGFSHTCVIFPANLSLGSKNKNVAIYIDYSKLNLAWIVRDRLFSRVEEKSAEITKELTENILSKLLLTKNEILTDIVLLGLAGDNEDEISGKNNEAFLLITSINTTIGLNASDIDKLESKISSVKAAFDITIDKATGNVEFSEDIVNSGGFSESDKDDYLDELDEQKDDIEGQRQYVESLFSPAYSGSINNTLGNIKLRVIRLNLNANITDALIASSKANLYNISLMLSLNGKLINKMAFSMDNVKKNLESIDKLSAEDIASPVIADIKPLTSYNSYLNYIFPTLMAMAIMFASLLLSAIVVVMEFSTPAYFRNAISPTGNVLFFSASYLTNLSLIGLQIFIMLLISMMFFFSQVIGNILTILAVCFLTASFFIVLGMGIGYLFKKEQMSILAATFASSIFLFLSNVLTPIENMPEFFMRIAQFSPFIISVSLLRKSILFGQSLISINAEILYLVVFTLSLLAVYAAVYYRNLRR